MATWNTPLYLWNVIPSLNPWYLLLAHESSIRMRESIFVHTKQKGSCEIDHGIDYQNYDEYDVKNDDEMYYGILDRVEYIQFYMHGGNIISNTRTLVFSNYCQLKLS